MKEEEEEEEEEESFRTLKKESEYSLCAFYIYGKWGGGGRNCLSTHEELRAAGGDFIIKEDGNFVLDRPRKHACGKHSTHKLKQNSPL